MVELQPSKLVMRVLFPSPSPPRPADQQGSPGTQFSAAQPPSRRLIVPLPATVSRPLPAVASHAIGSTEPRHGTRSQGIGAYREGKGGVVSSATPGGSGPQGGGGPGRAGPVGRGGG